MRRWSQRTLVVAAGALLLACGGRQDVTAGRVSIDARPLTTQLPPGGSLRFGAAVTGSADTSVAWSVVETTGCGTVSSNGFYVAPPSVATCHVRAASSADPSATVTVTVEVKSTVEAAWRPFAAASPWNSAIAPNPDLEPDSAALIADFIASSPWGPHLDVNLSSYSIPLYPAGAATPSYAVRADVGGDGWNGTNTTAAMPIPFGATPDPAGDHHLLVVDAARGIEWGCWKVTAQDGQWHAGLCASADLLGSGVRPPVTLAQPWYTAVGARACGFPLIAGLIRADEIQAGRIDHALVVAYPHIRSGWFTPPASTGQAANGVGAIHTRGIPCGGRIQFDPSVDVNALPLSTSGRTIVRALQQYGAYVGDYSGALSLYAESSPAAQAYFSNGVLQTYELMDKIDLTRFRVLRSGVLYDNGNGG